MQSTRVKAGVGVLAAAALLILGAVLATYIKHQREIDTVADEQKIARSLEIIRTSTPENRKVLKVLFYGQSITKSGWDAAVIEHWHQKYPNTIFVTQNRALGGFPSTDLVRTTEQDIAAFYPDLIIFHVYGDHHAYERIIRLFRSQTAADIIVQTDHADVLPDPPCAEGLQPTLHNPPGCVGHLWVHQREWNDEMSYHKIPAIAKKYSLALEPQRIWWRDYLLRTHVDPRSMTLDGLHPNAKGKEMIANYFNQYFDGLVEKWNGQTENHVRSIPTSEVKQEERVDSISFEGNRLELITNKPLAAWPTVTVDGQLTGDIDGCYLVSRASTVEIVPDWPAVRRIMLLHDHAAQDWTATLTNISPDQSKFSFTVKASLNGDGGTGTSTQNFVSKFGKLKIDAQDWMPARAFALKHVGLHAPFSVQWSVSNVCAGSPEVIDLGDGATQYRYVLASGLTNQMHHVALHTPIPDLASVSEFRAYKPSLKE
jgi:hypothetical protein